MCLLLNETNKVKVSRPRSARYFIFLLELCRVALNINLFLRKVNDVLDSQSRDMVNLDGIQLIVFYMLYLLMTILTFFSPEMILENSHDLILAAVNIHFLRAAAFYIPPFYSKPSVVFNGLLFLVSSFLKINYKMLN